MGNLKPFPETFLHEQELLGQVLERLQMPSGLIEDSSPSHLECIRETVLFTLSAISESFAESGDMARAEEGARKLLVNQWKDGRFSSPLLELPGHSFSNKDQIEAYAVAQAGAWTSCVRNAMEAAGVNQGNAENLLSQARELASDRKRSAEPALSETIFNGIPEQLDLSGLTTEDRKSAERTGLFVICSFWKAFSSGGDMAQDYLARNIARGLVSCWEDGEIGRPHASAIDRAGGAEDLIRRLDEREARKYASGVAKQFKMVLLPHSHLGKAFRRRVGEIVRDDVRYPFSNPVYWVIKGEKPSVWHRPFNIWEGITKIFGRAGQGRLHRG